MSTKTPADIITFIEAEVLKAEGEYKVAVADKNMPRQVDLNGQQIALLKVLNFILST